MKFKMKKYIFSLLSAAALFGFTSCDGTQDEPHIQWYPVVTLEGDDTYYLELGEDFTLPGFTAVNTITGEDVTSKVTVEIYDVIAGEYVDEISTASPGMYNVYYISPASEVSPYPDYEMYKQRDIYVYDPTIETDISGSYNINMDKTIYLSNGKTFAELAAGYGNVDSSTVTISQLLPGFFYVSDLLGGWYDQIRAYGSSYAMTGYISLNADNSITLLSSHIAGWGDGLDGLWDGHYDAETQTISYETLYAGSIGMDIVMTNANAE